MSKNTNSKFKRKIRLCLVHHTNEIFQSYNINQIKFDRSIEYFNDSDVYRAIERLTFCESKKELNFDKTLMLQVIECYNRNVGNLLEKIELKNFDSQIYLSQIEDQIYEEFHVELGDIVAFYFASQDGEIQSRVHDLRQSFSSIQKMNQSIFE